MKLQVIAGGLPEPIRRWTRAEERVLLNAAAEAIGETFRRQIAALPRAERAAFLEVIKARDWERLEVVLTVRPSQDPTDS